MKATVTMIEDAYVRHREWGFDISMNTSNKVARELLIYDEKFSACEYTQLVFVVREWQRSRKR